MTGLNSFCPCLCRYFYLCLSYFFPYLLSLSYYSVYHSHSHLAIQSCIFSSPPSVTTFKTTWLWLSMQSLKKTCEYSNDVSRKKIFFFFCKSNVNLSELPICFIISILSKFTIIFQSTNQSTQLKSEVLYFFHILSNDPC